MANRKDRSNLETGVSGLPGAFSVVRLLSLSIKFGIPEMVKS